MRMIAYEKRIVSLLSNTLLISFAIAFSVITVCFADEVGYIFQVSDPIEDEVLLTQVEIVYENAGIYRTSHYSVIQALKDSGELVAVTMDTEVSLMDLEQDIDALQKEEWTHAMLGTQYATESDLSGAGVRVGLIDSGIRSDFSELTGAAVLTGVNYLASADSPDRTNTADLVGHGTYVASMIASNRIGLAPAAELIPFKCFDDTTSSISYVVSAIYDAVDTYQCQVLNFSLGTAVDNPFLRAAIAHAYDCGVIMVAASGNLSFGRTSTGDDGNFYPAAYDEVISVGAVDHHKQIATFSVQNPSVWVTAPGDRVKGLSRTGTSYKVDGGTSYAVPYVAAAAALALEADPTLTPSRYTEVLKETAEDLGKPGRDNAYGYGLLNLGLMLAQVRNDSESIILTVWDEMAAVSLFQPESIEGRTMILAYYAEDGRFVGAKYIFQGSAAYWLNNHPLPDDISSVAVFTLEENTYIPLKPAHTR